MTNFAGASPLEISMLEVLNLDEWITMPALIKRCERCGSMNASTVHSTTTRMVRAGHMLQKYFKRDDSFATAAPVRLVCLSKEGNRLVRAMDAFNKVRAGTHVIVPCVQQRVDWRSPKEYAQQWYGYDAGGPV